MLKTKRMNLLGEAPSTTEEQAPNPKTEATETKAERVTTPAREQFATPVEATIAPTVPADKETAPVPADTTETATADTDELITIQVEPMAVEAPNSSILDITDTTAPDSGNPAPAVGTLPADYLHGGYYKGEGKIKYPNPALVDHAEAIGKALAVGGVTPTAINRMIKTLKDVKKKPFDAQQGAMKKLLPLALKEKKAPPLLREVVERNKIAVQTEADFAACLDHMQDIAVFLTAATQTK